MMVLERLPIIRKPLTTVHVNNYEVLETGETFSSFSSDIALAFSDYVRDQELQSFVSSWMSDNQSQALSLELPAFEETIPQLKPGLTPRQEKIEKLLLRAFAESLAWALSNLNVERCEACEIFDPSQLHHDCIMPDPATIVARYTNEALERVDEDKAMALLTKYTNEELDCPLNGLELLRYECKDSRFKIFNRRMEEFKNIVFHAYEKLLDNEQ